MVEDPLDFCAADAESGPDSGPEVMGEDGLGEAWKQLLEKTFSYLLSYRRRLQIILLEINHFLPYFVKQRLDCQGQVARLARDGYGDQKL